MNSKIVLSRLIVGTVLFLAFLLTSGADHLHTHDEVAHKPHAHSCEPQHDVNPQFKRSIGDKQLKKTKTSGPFILNSKEPKHCHLCLLFLLKQPQKPSDPKYTLIRLEPSGILENQWINDKIVQLGTISPYQARAGPTTV
jgi:hypothetical protein